MLKNPNTRKTAAYHLHQTSNIHYSTARPCFSSQFFVMQCGKFWQPVCVTTEISPCWAHATTCTLIGLRSLNLSLHTALCFCHFWHYHLYIIQHILPCFIGFIVYTNMCTNFQLCNTKLLYTQAKGKVMSLTLSSNIMQAEDPSC